MADDLRERLAALSATLGSVETVLDLPKMHKELDGLEREAADPDLWNDQERAQKVTSSMSYLRGDLSRVEALRGRVDDMQAALDLDDADLISEAAADMPQVSKDIEALEVRTLLSGDYDEREALVTINSGTGGTDAADWAEMLLRMYLRWAERHNHPTEVFDTSYAEEAGIKSATFVVHTPYAYGTLAGEHGVHRLVRISPFDNQSRRQTSFAGVDITPVVEATSRSRTTRSGSTSIGRPGRAARASTPPTRRCGSRTCRPASSSPARTSAVRSRTVPGPWMSCRQSFSTYDASKRPTRWASSRVHATPSGSAATTSFGTTCCTLTKWSRTPGPR
jgi:hypothetical protein